MFLLGFVEFDQVVDVGFRGEFGGDLAFGAAQDEWGDAEGELLSALVVIFFFDRGLEVALKLFVGAEQSGVEEVHEAPELG